MRAPGDHVTECTIVEFNHNQVTEALPKLKELTKYLKECRKSILDNSKILIKQIEEEARQALNRIRDLQKTVFDLMSERCINKENYERIQCIPIENRNYNEFTIKNTKRLIKNCYRLYDYEEITWKECNAVIFARDPIEGLLSIDLDTFKLSKLDYAPKVGKYCHACKINQNTYFFHGGIINDVHRSEAYLINIKDSKYETVTNGPTKSCGGRSAVRNNKIYIFGGQNGRDMKTCDTFDLKTKEWRSITALPQSSQNITAAVLNNDIILSGYAMGCCYSYNDSTYTNILNLPASAYKLVCEGWIYTNSILYENEDQSLSKWTTHNAIEWNYYMWTYCAFKKNQYIYFIDKSNLLIRIDTKLKKVESIGFS